MKDFFISYNNADRAWAEWIAWQLEEASYSTILQAWDFRPGSNFVLEMDGASKEASRTMPVLSPDYLQAEYTQPEWAAAFCQDPTGQKGTLVPVRVRECTPEGLLAQDIRIDLVGLDEAAARRALLEGIKRERAKPQRKPSFPVEAARAVLEKPQFPGALPPIWNVPHRRNPNFTGREELLKRLREELTSGRTAAITQAIHGLGGVGKTQLAVEHAYRHTADYDLIWWIRCEEPAKLASDYAALAGELDLPQKDEQDQGIIIEAVRRWLDQNGGWLLIFDNAGELEDITAYLPQAAHGYIIITSRNPVWGGAAEKLSVHEFEKKESVEFLLRRTQQEDASAAAVLAEELGDLPLALEQAAAYIEETGTALADYLALLRARRSELLERGKPAIEYEYTVATTWAMSFEALAKECPAATDLLTLCAFLAPDDIPVDLFTAGADYFAGPLWEAAKDSLTFNTTVAALRRYSLVETANGAMSVHRLVQAVVRDRLSEHASARWTGIAVRLVNGAFPTLGIDLLAWPECARLLPHALAAAGHAERLHEVPEETVRLLNLVSLYLFGRAEFERARVVLERALSVVETIYGTDSPEQAIMLDRIGSLLRELGDVEGAADYFMRALQIDDAAHGRWHRKVAIRLNNLGGVLREQGDLEEARACYEEALWILRLNLGEGDPTARLVQKNLYLLCLESLFGQSLGCKERLAGTLKEEGACARKRRKRP